MKITVHNLNNGRHDNNNSYDNSKFNGFLMCVPNGNTGNERVQIYYVGVVRDE